MKTFKIALGQQYFGFRNTTKTAKEKSKIQEETLKKKSGVATDKNLRGSDNDDAIIYFCGQ